MIEDSEPNPIFSSSSRLVLQFSEIQWPFPNLFLGFWSIQPADFQHEFNLYTTDGCLAFLGWCMHHYEFLFREYPYFAEYFLSRDPSLRYLMTRNIIANDAYYIPVFFYVVYQLREDLKQLFNIQTLKGLYSFYLWSIQDGALEYQKNYYYVNFLREQKNQSVYSSNNYFYFDEDCYLEAYPEVAAAIKSGIIPSGYEHWLKYGRFEGKLLYENNILDEFIFDEKWYLETYPDVMDAVKSGFLSSGKEHWEKQGKKEGRQSFDIYNTRHIKLVTEKPILSSFELSL